MALWGVRGSLATPEAANLGYGGNTCCVHLELDDAHLVLDAGTGIRRLGGLLAGDDPRPVHILLTHLHLDHIVGLLFFAPLFDPGREVTIWGPAASAARNDGGDLRTRLARYLSAPLSPVELRELPASVSFEHCPATPWELGGARVRAESVLHRGPTLGYRVEHGGRAFAYLPDHEPVLSGDLDGDPEWISGASVARGADVLLHDGQYTPEQYAITRGWGHSTFADAVRFAARAGVGELLLTHHDPSHDDAALDAIAARARAAAADCGLAAVGLAREGLQRG
jgi:phosphoribosyl 1,2-cyclic phosphodiesterase